MGAGLQYKRRYSGWHLVTSRSHWLADSGDWHQLVRVHLLPGSALGSEERCL